MSRSVNYYENGDQLERHPTDFYRTDPRIVTAVLSHLATEYVLYTGRVLDPGAGEGIWGDQIVKFAQEQVWSRPKLAGVELRELPKPACYTNDDLWITGVDYVAWANDVREEGRESFDLIVGNWPFNGMDYRPPLWEQFFHASWPLVKRHGFVMTMLPIKVICGITRAKGLWRDYPPIKFMPLCPRPSHYENSRQTNKNDYGVAVWLKSPTGKPVGTPGRFMCEPLVWLETEPHEAKQKRQRSKK